MAPAKASRSDARATPALEAPSPPRWIISAREDLLWFQGSVLAGFGLLAVFCFLPQPHGASGPWHPALIVVLLWGVCFDGTHVWGTYARTYFAPDDSSRSGLPGRAAWSLVLVGPAIALADASLDALDPARAELRLFPFFLVGAYLWAYWHLVRQHYGFVMLYRKRAGESDQRGARLDSALLWIGCLYPYVRFALGDAYAESGLPQLVPASLLAAATVALDSGFVLVLLAAIALVISGRVEPFRPGPKHLLLVSVIAFHVAVFALLGDLLTILATLTIFHNLQYHRIVWQYERGHGRVPSGGLVRYLALGLALGVVWYVPRVAGVAAADSDLARHVLVGLGWGVAFHHYLVDGRIWRVRRSPAVARALDAGRGIEERPCSAMAKSRSAPAEHGRFRALGSSRGHAGAPHLSARR